MFVSEAPNMMKIIGGMKLTEGFEAHLIFLNINIKKKAVGYWIIY